MSVKKINFSVLVSPDLHRRIRAEAARNMRSASSEAVLLLEEALKQRKGK